MMGAIRHQRNSKTSRGLRGGPGLRDERRHCAGASARGAREWPAPAAQARSAHEATRDAEPIPHKLPERLKGSEARTHKEDAMNQRTTVALSAMVIMCMVSSVAEAQNGGGQVMPPSARPQGFSLTEMARLTAPFTTSSNDHVFYPVTPFQILYFKTQICAPSSGHSSLYGW